MPVCHVVSPLRLPCCLGSLILEIRSIAVHTTAWQPKTRCSRFEVHVLLVLQLCTIIILSAKLRNLRIGQQLDCCQIRGSSLVPTHARLKVHHLKLEGALCAPVSPSSTSRAKMHAVAVVLKFTAVVAQQQYCRCLGGSLARTQHRQTLQPP